MPRKKTWKIARAKRGARNPNKIKMTIQNGDAGSLNGTKTDVDSGDTGLLNNSITNILGDTDFYQMLNNSNINCTAQMDCQKDYQVDCQNIVQMDCANTVKPAEVSTGVLRPPHLSGELRPPTVVRRPVIDRTTVQTMDPSVVESLEALERTAAWVSQVAQMRQTNMKDATDSTGDSIPDREMSNDKDYDDAPESSETFYTNLYKEHFGTDNPDVEELCRNEFVDIPSTVYEFKEALEKAGISQRFAAKYIMESTSQGNLSFLLEKGKNKHWCDLSGRGRLPYIRMRHWLDSKDEQMLTLRQLDSSKESKKTGPKDGNGKRGKFTLFQLMVLCRFFEEDTNPSLTTRMLLAEKLYVSLERITIWFQNQRARGFPAKRILCQMSYEHKALVNQRPGEDSKVENFQNDILKQSKSFSQQVFNKLKCINGSKANNETVNSNSTRKPSHLLQTSAMSKQDKSNSNFISKETSKTVHIPLFSLTKDFTSTEKSGTQNGMITESSVEKTKSERQPSLPPFPLDVGISKTQVDILKSIHGGKYPQSQNFVPSDQFQNSHIRPQHNFQISGVAADKAIHAEKLRLKYSMCRQMEAHSPYQLFTKVPPTSQGKSNISYFDMEDQNGTEMGKYENGFLSGGTSSSKDENPAIKMEHHDLPLKNKRKRGMNYFDNELVKKGFYSNTSVSRNLYTNDPNVLDTSAPSKPNTFDITSETGERNKSIKKEYEEQNLSSLWLSRPVTSSSAFSGFFEKMGNNSREVQSFPVTYKPVTFAQSLETHGLCSKSTELSQPLNFSKDASDNNGYINVKKEPDFNTDDTV